MKIGIIGLGHLGRSLLQGLLCSGIAPDEITAYNRTASVCDAVCEKFGIDATGDPGYVVETSDVIFFVTKGAALEELSESIPSKAYAGKTVVSFMAGIRPEKLESACPGAEIVVAMPTVSIADCTGIIAHTKAPENVSQLFKRLGYSFETTAAGGAIGLVRDGDRIEIDIPARSIRVLLSEDELERRRQEELARGDKAFTPPFRVREVSKSLKIYAKMVSSADKGAVREI
jgi:hypothetical protein